MKITDECMGCGQCLEACPFNAIDIKSSHGYAQCYIDERLCKNCEACLNLIICPAEAIKRD